jgi:hypothetical protein
MMMSSRYDVSYCVRGNRINLDSRTTELYNRNRAVRAEVAVDARILAASLACAVDVYDCDGYALVRGVRP